MLHRTRLRNIAYTFRRSCRDWVFAATLGPSQAIVRLAPASYVAVKSLASLLLHPRAFRLPHSQELDQLLPLSRLECHFPQLRHYQRRFRPLLLLLQAGILG